MGKDPSQAEREAANARRRLKIDLLQLEERLHGARAKGGRVAKGGGAAVGGLAALVAIRRFRSRRQTRAAAR
jgi:hypothetical protein